MNPIYYVLIPLTGFALFNRGRFLYKGIRSKDTDRILVEVMFLLIIFAVLFGIIFLIETM